MSDLFDDTKYLVICRFYLSDFVGWSHQSEKYDCGNGPISLVVGAKAEVNTW
jgi:hypothetical protein